MNKKPNVFPNGKSFKEAMDEANETGVKISNQLKKENQIQSKSIHKSEGELKAELQMKTDSINLLEKQILEANKLMEDKKKEILNNSINKPTKAKIIHEAKNNLNKSKETMVMDNVTDKAPSYDNLYTPQTDVPYDIIELPSRGLLYKNKQSKIKLAFLNGMDESIITNPNLLKSGEFLEVLINRKMLDTDIKYKDLHIGDRNAIMIWLRSTGYGPMYNIVLSNPKSKEYEEFTVEIDLSKIKVKYLSKYFVIN